MKPQKQLSPFSFSKILALNQEALTCKALQENNPVTEVPQTGLKNKHTHLLFIIKLNIPKLFLSLQQFVNLSSLAELQWLILLDQLVRYSLKLSNYIWSIYIYVCVYCIFNGSVCNLTALVCPHMQLLGQLRYDQESPPALALLWFENVTKNVVSDVEDVFSFGTQ